MKQGERLLASSMCRIYGLMVERGDYYSVCDESRDQIDRAIREVYGVRAMNPKIPVSFEEASLMLHFAAAVLSEVSSQKP
jgi:hypothetical protein